MRSIHIAGQLELTVHLGAHMVLTDEILAVGVPIAAVFAFFSRSNTTGLLDNLSTFLRFSLVTRLILRL